MHHPNLGISFKNSRKDQKLVPNYVMKPNEKGKFLEDFFKNTMTLEIVIQSVKLSEVFPFKKILDPQLKLKH